MKKMKKFLTALLATATIFSMSAMPTFAEETTPAQDLSKLTITKVLSMEEDGVIPDTTFSFTMTPLTEGAYKNAEGKTILGETTEKLDIYPGVALTKDSVDISFHNGDTLTKVEKTVDDQKVVSYEVSKTETFDLSVLKGEDMGVYRYVVEETIPEKNNGTINYDTTKYIVDVTIDKDGEIAYVISTNQTKNEKMPIEFKNSVASDKLIVKKLVTGQMGDKTKQFDFILNIPVAGDALNLRSATTIEGSIVRQNGTPDPVTITVGQDFAFTLADGEYLEIKGLPNGMIYTVTESAKHSDYATTIQADVTGTDGSTTRTLKDTKVYNASENGTPIADGGNTITFTNNKELVKTGLTFDMAPYLAILVIAVGGALIVFASRKRRTER